VNIAKTDQINQLHNYMDTHSLGFKIDKPDEAEGYPKFLVQLDGANEDHSFVVLPLEISAQKDGLYPILNCTCGEWGCGGGYVKVKITPERVIWENNYSYIDETTEMKSLHVKMPIYFKRDEYQKLINDLLIAKDKYKYEKNVYESDREDYRKNGMGSLYTMK
jgi:hypothetical protein